MRYSTNGPLRLAACSLFFALGLGSASHAFTTLQLTDLFYSEGANFGDFNNDGIKDIVAGPYWYAGPTYTQSTAYYEPVALDKNLWSGNFFAWSDDIDGDGWDDILIGGFPGTQATWYENPQGGTGFWTAHPIFDGLDNESPHYVDITGDGARELVFHHLGRWGWAEPTPGNPAAPWVFQPVTPSGNYTTFTHGMGVGDVNGDGRMDILEKGGWWEHPAGDPTAVEWTLHEHDFAPNGTGGAQMYAYDFDGDGDNDIVSSSQAHGWGLYWFEQIDLAGQIDFLSHPIIDATLEGSPEANAHGVVFSQLHALELADIDNDGIADVVTGKRHWAHSGADPDANGAAVLYWFETVRGPGGVDFVPHLIDDDSGVGTQVVAGDLDGDGWKDIVVGNKKGTFVFLSGPPECGGLLLAGLVWLRRRRRKAAA